MTPSEARMLDRINRLIAKNAAALNEPVMVGARRLRDGRVRVDWLARRGMSKQERRVEPRTYESVEAAYREAIAAHLLAHHLVLQQRAA